MTVNSVCAHEKDDRIQNQRPDIFWRRPGMSPGQLISGTSANDQGGARGYFDNVGNRHLNEATKSENTLIGDRTEVQCSWFFAGWQTDFVE